MDPADVQMAELGMLPGQEGMEQGGVPAEGGGTPDPKSVINSADQKRGEL